MAVTAVVALAAVAVGFAIGWFAASRRARRRRTREVKPRTDIASLVDSVIKVSVKAKELAPTVRDSIQGIQSWVEAARPSLRKDLAPDGTVTIVFSDIESSTAINAELGDEAWMDELRSHSQLVAGLVKRNRGHVVKSQGDGFMLAFKEPRDATRCALDLQRELDAVPDGGDRLRLSVRVGVHKGEVISEDGDFFGANVAFAARVAQKATGGEVLVSEAVKEAVGDDDGLSFSEPRVVELKGIPGRHPLFAVA